MKKKNLILVLTSALVSNFAYASSVKDCLNKVDAIQQEVVDIALYNLPSMTTPDHQGKGYQMQYGSMLGETSSNYRSLMILLKKSCEDAVRTSALVKKKEI